METKHAQHFKAHDFNSVPFGQKPRSSYTMWIVVICIIFFVFLIWSKWSRVSDFLWFGAGTGTVASWLTIGQQVSIEGDLSQDGDFITHTHKLYTLSNGVFGLKSKTINMNQYTGMVSIEGIVDGERDGIYIIDVSKIISEIQSLSGNVLSGIVQTGVISSQWIYLPKAWVFFSPGFESEYSLQNSGENGQIKLTHTTTNQKVVINYFACKKWDPNKDCAQLQQTFSTANEKKFTTANGDVYYKLAEVNSWFVTNQWLFGYFINDIPEQEVISLSNYIVLPTVQYVQSSVVPHISSLCKQGNIVMTAATKSNLYLEKGIPVLKISGTWDNGTAECKIQLNPSLSVLWTVSNFTYKENAVQTGQTTEIQPVVQHSSSTPSQPLTVEAGVKQFAITLDKTTEFPSKRGHTIIFPSKKVSYQSANISNDFGVKGVHCYVETDVIDFANKALLTTNPTVKVYECDVKNGVVVPGTFVTTTLTDGRVFLVEALDPAWIDFANNVQIVLNN